MTLPELVPRGNEAPGRVATSGKPGSGRRVKTSAAFFVRRAARLSSRGERFEAFEGPNPGGPLGSRPWRLVDALACPVTRSASGSTVEPTERAPTRHVAPYAAESARGTDERRQNRTVPPGTSPTRRRRSIVRLFRAGSENPNVRAHGDERPEVRGNAGRMFEGAGTLDYPETRETTPKLEPLPRNRLGILEFVPRLAIVYGTEKNAGIPGENARK